MYAKIQKIGKPNDKTSDGVRTQYGHEKDSQKYIYGDICPREENNSLSNDYII
jgi:hypothetical protein